MHFSEVFRVPEIALAKADWFDPILDNDTELFIDPFLVYKSRHPVFNGAQDQIVSFFEHTFRLAASLQQESDAQFRDLVALLEFPEVREICLGYANASIKGLGTGETYARDIAVSVMSSVDIASIKPEHFEMIGLLQQGIGPDRISDMTANLLKERLATYTQAICSSLDIATSPHRLTVFDFGQKKWRQKQFDLPTNPLAAGNRAVLLVPQEFLSNLLTVNTADFGNFLWNQYDAVRSTLSYEIKSQLKAKRNIIQVVKAIRESVKDYQAHLEGREPKPYDLASDPKGLYRWDAESRGYSEAHPLHLSVPRSDKELLTLLADLAVAYKGYVEGGVGRPLLWNNGRPKSQEAARRVLQGLAVKYLRMNGITVSRPDYWGRRPVSLTFPDGKDVPVLAVVKLLKNSRSVYSFAAMTRRYKVTYGIRNVVLVAVGFSEEELTRATEVQTHALEVGRAEDVGVRVVVVNATQGGPAISAI